VHNHSEIERNFDLWTLLMQIASHGWNFQSRPILTEVDHLGMYQLCRHIPAPPESEPLESLPFQPKPPPESLANLLQAHSSHLLIRMRLVDQNNLLHLR